VGRSKPFRERRVSQFLLNTSFTDFILIRRRVQQDRVGPSMAMSDFESFRSKRVLTPHRLLDGIGNFRQGRFLLTMSKLLSGMECHSQCCSHKLRQNSDYLIGHAGDWSRETREL